jgi:hypothetical protein
LGSIKANEADKIQSLHQLICRNLFLIEIELITTGVFTPILNLKLDARKSEKK